MPSKTVVPGVASAWRPRRTPWKPKKTPEPQGLRGGGLYRFLLAAFFARAWLRSSFVW